LLEIVESSRKVLKYSTISGRSSLVLVDININADFSEADGRASDHDPVLAQIHLKKSKQGPPAWVKKSKQEPSEWVKEHLENKYQ
jgi:hypothetical protein